MSRKERHRLKEAVLNLSESVSTLHKSIVISILQTLAKDLEEGLYDDCDNL